MSGTPGGALLYALIAVLVWPRRSRNADGAAAAAADAAGSSNSIASRGLLGGLGAKLAWLVLWGSGAVLLLLGPNRAAGGLRATIAGGAGGEPGWIGAIDRTMASVIGTNGLAVSVVLAVVFAVIAVGVFVPAMTRPVLVLAVIAALTIWVVGENLGGILTGQGTDPGNGLLLTLLAASFWPLAGSARRVPATSPIAAVSAGSLPANSALASRPGLAHVPARTGR